MVRGDTIRFRGPVDVTVTQDDDGFWCESEELCAIGNGSTAAGAQADMMADIAVVYNGLVGEPDEKLTKDARELRDNLVRLVEIV